MRTLGDIFLAAAIILVIGLLAGAAYKWWQPAKPPSPSWDQGTVVRSTPTGLWRLQWGYEEGQVRYLAFIHGGAGDPHPPILVSRPMRGGKIILSRPNQSQEELPAGFNVFELVDGRLEQQHISLTVEQAKAYCDTKRDTYTIRTLRDFLNTP